MPIIPARAGSSLPAKNLRRIHGRSLIERAIDCAESAVRLLPDIVVTSDCPRCLELAVNRDCIPIARPWYLAGDDSPTINAVWHVLQEIGYASPRSGVPIDAVCLLQATNPLRLPEDVDKAIELMELSDCGSVHTIAPARSHPARQTWADGSPVIDAGYFANVRRQDLPEVYDRDGAVYLTRVEVLARGSWYAEDGRAIVLPLNRHLDIEDEHDLRIAAALLTK